MGLKTKNKSVHYVFTWLKEYYEIRGVGNVLLKSNVKSNGKSGIQQSMIKAYVFTGNTPVHTHNVCSHS